MDELRDKFGRRLNYIRISITDRCNYRCVYCMPENGVEWIPHERILSYEEMILLADVLNGLGVEKIRFTGGEPLVRKGFFHFLDELKRAVPRIRTVLTTNGSLIRDHFDMIASSPISGINISLDSLKPELFRSITRTGSLADVTEGINMISSRTSIPIKINTVLMKGVNDGEIPDLIVFAQQNKSQLRLIEFMPLDDSVWKGDLFISAAEIIEKLKGSGEWQLLDNSGDHSAGPAKYYQNTSTGQKLGIIEAVTHHFCDTCNRLRITATGVLRPCLFSEEGIDLRPALLAGDPEEVKALIFEGALRKPRSFKAVETGNARMSRVGG